MKNKHLWTVMLTVIFIMLAVIPAYAQIDPVTEPEVIVTPSPEPTIEITPEQTPLPEANPLTVDGTGTLSDTATDKDSKEFYTITTEAGNVFFLIIDHQKEDNNVYFLNAVTEADLMALAEKSEDSDSGESVIPSPAPEPSPKPSAEVEGPDNPEPDAKEDTGSVGITICMSTI